MKIMIMLMIINDNLRKSRGDHAKEDHHVEANKTLGGKDHRVKLTITKGHIPAYDYMICGEGKNVN